MTKNWNLLIEILLSFIARKQTRNAITPPPNPCKTRLLSSGLGMIPAIIKLVMLAIAIIITDRRDWPASLGNSLLKK
jgi:hypothetical protein